ncbi:MAG: DnaD domain protein [Bacilli bacterium]|nr:DnaD domain protein [Bacilli bacterium]
MNNSKVVDLFRERNIVVPIYLLKNYKKFNVELDCFLFLIYLYNLGNKTLFNPNLFSKELNMDLSMVMSFVDDLTEKKLIRVEVLKNDKGLMEEVIVLDDFYNKLTYLIMGEKTDNSSSTIYSVIENEFGRTLSSIEVTIINAWLEHQFSEELIKEALKEAVFNGVTNLRYIDRILYEWEKDGVKTIQDVEERRKKRQKLKEKENNVDIDIVDWDWFDED